MRKNIRLIIFTAFVMTGLSSCTKWLDIQPTDRVSDETLFSDSKGFRTALNGIYQQVAVPQLYGRQLTWGINSAMANDYYPFNLNDELKSASNADLANNNIKGSLADIWRKAYTAIANCNKLLIEIEGKDDSFFQFGRSEKNLIKGEALALRALLHFDVVRIFSPATIRNNEQPFVPYQEYYPAHIAEALTTKEIMVKIIRDFELAQALVEENDLTKNSFYLSGGLAYTLNGISTQDLVFFTFRMNRLNYVAINALLARAAMYSGDYVKAKKAAFLVYNFGPDGKRWFSFTPEYLTNSVTRSQKLPEDLLLAFYDPKLVTNIKDYRGTLTFQLNTNYQTFFPPAERDYRRNIINTTDNVSYKWLESVSQTPQNLIMPVVRLSEAYYIYSECLYREGNTTDALIFLNKIRSARGKSSAFLDITENGYYGELLMEYRREYMSEGQTIFAHKRLNRRMVLGNQTIEVNDRFTAPVPEDER
ncbi:RagB/SusD family nutrient uptake outer membrane protein [Pedobacter hiemivivus]|uniref:RagB/SusD family nutrient uptake outer membrane protein n=1 Tax=Pedobacter hiemivivus TaxID=2530454 RepID=A0A4U1GHN3_9SPHI|nr:RagB/SusD family nutrient uptake outer membrane protein [Pedobacter hiemivivus]TKC62413.1 RagB/SusD family nutrient uptake outer membrane protein [Pedobacter hiemivivus]